MSNRLFQGIVHQMKDSLDRVIGVIDENGTVIACSELSKIGESQEQIIIDLSYTMDVTTYNGYTYKPLSGKTHLDYAVFVEGVDETAATFVNILTISLHTVKQYYDEKYDKSNFIKNVILDNILPGDIYIKGKELHFNSDVSRVVLLIRLVEKTEISVFDILKTLFPEKQKDFIININETDTVLVKEVKDDVEAESLAKLAKSIADTLNSEFYTRVYIGIGTVAPNIKELAKSFKEAQIALEVGKVFDTEKTIVLYEDLGIGRLIYQLPTTLCEMFLNEVFKKDSIDSLDQETLFTIQKFFENNLNVSETSRKLFVHRNTLVYRLEKIRKITGLDLREFDHAIVFKVALMVKKYLVSNPAKF